MTRAEYSEYLKGRHWRRFRMKVIRDAGGKCEICGTNYPGHRFSQRIEVHHWTYKNVPHEKRTDVSALCALCHKHTHLVLDGRIDEICEIEREFFEYDDEVKRLNLVTYTYKIVGFADVVLELNRAANK